MKTLIEFSCSFQNHVLSYESVPKKLYNTIRILVVVMLLETIFTNEERKREREREGI